MVTLGTVLAFLAVFTLYAVTIRADEDSENVHDFDVIPGGAKHHVEYEWKGIKCAFTYVCQGGTKEEWELLIEKVGKKGKKMKCIIRRSRVSYLFFQEFLVEVTGAKIKEARLKGPSQEVHADEYIVEDRKVSNGPAFKNALNEVELFLTRSKEEL